MKKRTIFKIFIIPIILVILVQAFITYGSVILSGSTTMLANNSVDILDHTVESRKNMLENSMIQQWSDVKEEKEQVDEALAALLQREAIGIEEFLKDDRLQNELLQEMLPACLYMLRKNVVTGSFMIVGAPEPGGEDYICDGIYFRDMDPGINSGEYSDVLLERGSSAFAQELGIPLNTLWTTKFHFAEEGEQEADNFYYRPVGAAIENPDTNYKNLAYWSPPFYLEGDSIKDSHQMITYSVPLVYDGIVYGVIGTEISRKYLLKQLSIQEVENSDKSGYVLGRYYEEENRIVPMLYTGFLGERISGMTNGITLSETDFNSLYMINEITSVKDPVYASVSRLHLYNTNTLFEDEVWVLVGIQDHDSIFGFSDRIKTNLIMGILIAFVFSVIAIYFITIHITYPIRKLAETFSSGIDQLAPYKPFNIMEVDELYEVVNNLTEKQKENEYKLKEEKERYRIALLSSTDVLFTYDIKKDRLELFNVNLSIMELPERYRFSWINNSSSKDFIVPEHWKAVDNLIRNGTGEISQVIRMRYNTQIDFEWMEIKGTVINNINDERYKIIGSIKNVNEQKINELREQEEKRIDAVTGLYKAETGEKLLWSELSKTRRGYLALIDIDNFRILNEQYGMVFGNAILEEIGKLIRRLGDGESAVGEKYVIGIRVGGDEILLCLSDFALAEAKKFLNKLQDEVSRLYRNSTLHICLSAGMVGYDDCSYDELLGRAGKALALAKKEGGNTTILYEHLIPEQVMHLEEKGINEIASISYADKLNIVSLVFNFFDKGKEVGNILEVLLTKLGSYFQAKSIMIMMIDRDFHTSYLSHWWQAAYEENMLPEIHYFSSGEFEHLVETVGEWTGGQTWLERLSQLQRQFLHVPQKGKGISVPMYDRECYIGSLTFLKDDDALTEWGDGEESDIYEIIKIIETNIIREKHDLASQAKSDFLSRMSHEIRTPMNAIMGMASIALAEKEKPDKVEDCLNKISYSSNYLLGLINHILDMSKIESGKMKLEMRNLNLHELIEGTKNLVVSQAEKKQIYFEARTSILQEWVIGDELRLSQVLVNLLGNAVKFTKNGGNIIFKVNQRVVGKNQTEVYFSVQDDGIGVKEENRKKIFLSFEQADHSIGKEYGGTGLGLSISSHLVRMMGGNIELDSEVDQGSNFSFKIPMEIGSTKEAGASKEAAPSGEAFTSGKVLTSGEVLTSLETGISEINTAEDVKTSKALEGCRVLLVEDNSLNVEIAQTLMEMRGFIVEVAYNGQEAIDKYVSNEPGYYEVILMDIRMPVMDGLEAAKKIRGMGRADSESIPIIAMTANAFDEDMNKSIENGMNGHLTKPIDMKLLFDTIVKLLEER